MSDSAGNEENSVAAKAAAVAANDEEQLEDEEKILEGRHDVNYPALLTKDVPGG